MTASVFRGVFIAPILVLFLHLDVRMLGTPGVNPLLQGALAISNLALVVMLIREFWSLRRFPGLIALLVSSLLIGVFAAQNW